MHRELKFGKETRRRQDWGWVPGALMWILQIAIVCALAFMFVWYFGQRVSTIGDSMNPVLKNGDIVLVNRFIYDASTPKRGDIIVFKPNGNEELHSSIKRIVAIPGETIQIVDGKIYLENAWTCDTSIYKEEFAELIRRAKKKCEAYLVDQCVRLHKADFILKNNFPSSWQDSADSIVGEELKKVLVEFVNK